MATILRILGIIFFPHISHRDHMIIGSFPGLSNDSELGFITFMIITSMSIFSSKNSSLCYSPSVVPQK